MRILHVNKFAYPKGGAENYMLRTASHQNSAGHHVAVLGADPDTSMLSEDIRTFGLDVPDYHKLEGVAKLKAAKDVLWSRFAADAVDKALAAFSPDIVHLHNYAHQLSSSIISAIRSHQIPSVCTAHDYKLICPAYVANVNNADCFSCTIKVSPRLLREKCHHDSLAWSSVVGLEALLVRSRRMIPDRVIGPSKFMADALRSSWIGPLVDIDLVRNPVEPSGQDWVGSGGYLLYVGRLSREKGVGELISAAGSLGVPLVVAGDGPIRTELEEIGRSKRSDVKFVGHADQSTLAALRRDCLAQVVSSTWPENAPLSALEAAADGVPLLVTARGGLPELSTIGARTVVLADLSSVELSRAIDAIQYIDGDLERFRTETSWDRHMDELDRVYTGQINAMRCVS
ncbi:glycosyltransferase family 4 protein [Arthrobacter sp. NyZ413]|uniref:glycosyltransferase family 4 protein n=1 Tax=Arthrobacter sp. NyZ413 TaxID=3144669 RepID=UPI003BF8527C